MTFVFAVVGSSHGPGHSFAFIARVRTLHVTTTTSFFAFSALFYSSLSRFFFRALLRTVRCLRLFTRVFLSPFLRTLLLTKTGFPRASNESLLRSLVRAWCLARWGRPSHRATACYSFPPNLVRTHVAARPNLIQDPAMYALHASDLVLVRWGYRQTVPFSHMARLPAASTRPAVGRPNY